MIYKERKYTLPKAMKNYNIDQMWPFNTVLFIFKAELQPEQQ